MTANIFEQNLRVWDKKLKNQNRKVLLCLDNFSGHPANINLENIKILFFPPNTTALSQPMDQGIIGNLKQKYKKMLSRKKLK